MVDEKQTKHSHKDIAFQIVNLTTFSLDEKHASKALENLSLYLPYLLE